MGELKPLPYLRFHVDELKFDGQNWQVAFTPRGIAWEPKQVRPVPDSEMQRIWKQEKIPASLDGDSVKRYWLQIESGVKDYLIREYWSPDAKQ